MSIYDIPDFVPRIIRLLEDAVQLNSRLQLDKRELETEKRKLVYKVSNLEQLEEHQSSATGAVDGGASGSSSGAQTEIAAVRSELERVQDELLKKVSENEQLKAEYSKCVEERTTGLSTEIAGFRSQITNDQIESIEECNSLRQTIAQHEEVLTSKTQEIEVLQTQIATLQNENEHAHIEMRALRQKVDVLESEKAALTVSRDETAHSSARDLNRVGAMLIDANLEIERLKQALTATQSQATSSSTSAIPKPAASKLNSERIDFAAHASPLPDPRKEVLNHLPKIDIQLPDDGPHAYFTRTSLCSIIGGSMQALIVPVVGSAKELAKKWEISGYLCPKMNHNPWSPITPGKHGYMMVGLGREKETFIEPEVRHVFVGCESSHQYAGLYSCVRVEPLTKDEWHTLPEHVKSTYVETTRDKEKRLNPGTTAKVRAEYDTGERRAPCVMLQCVEFNLDFYKELVTANDRFFAVAGAPSKSPSKLKRARPIEDEAGQGDESSLPSLCTKKVNTINPAVSPPRKSGRTIVRLRMPDYVEH